VAATLWRRRGDVVTRPVSAEERPGLLGQRDWGVSAAITDGEAETARFRAGNGCTATCGDARGGGGPRGESATVGAGMHGTW